MAEPIHFSIQVNAPKERVYDVMLTKDTYEQWAATFQSGSTFNGKWEEGSEISFVDSSGSGMFGRIIESEPGKRVVIEYDGVVGGGERDSASKEAQQWIGAREIYDFDEQEGITTVKVALEGDQIEPEMAAMLSDAWPKALEKLKEIAEQRV